MRVLDPGHHYLVDNYDDETIEQEILFMKRIGEKYLPNQGPPHGGTNCQEMLRVLIDRTSYLNEQKPHKNNHAIVGKLLECLWLFEDRAAEQHRIDQFDFRPGDMELAPVCRTCGHVICKGH